MERLHFYTDIIKTLFNTTYQHFFQDGAPHTSWDFKFHLFYSVIKKSLEFGKGGNLIKARKNMDSHFNPPPKGFHLTKVKIPEWFRYEAHRLVKKVLETDLNLKPNQLNQDWWKLDSSFEEKQDLELEFNMPKGNQPNNQSDTIFYLHGGAYLFCSTNTHRPLFCKLGRKSNSQIAALNYSLAPEFPFPCALEDTVAAYLFLTSSKNSANPGLEISPNRIVVAGDSAGGNLASVFLLFLTRYSSLPMVAGGLLLSPWLDLSFSMPSFSKNMLDYLPGPPLDQDGNLLKGAKPYTFINESLISKAPEMSRKLLENGHFFVKEQWLTYPLVSPLFSDSFEGFPPLMIIVGECERLLDEAILFAQKVNTNQLESDSFNHPTLPPVTLQVYDHMPHVFQVFGFHPMAKKSFDQGAKFIRDCFNREPKQLDSELNNWAFRVNEHGALLPLEMKIDCYKVPKTLYPFNNNPIEEKDN